MTCYFDSSCVKGQSLLLPALISTNSASELRYGRTPMIGPNPLNSDVSRSDSDAEDELRALDEQSGVPDDVEGREFGRLLGRL